MARFQHRSPPPWRRPAALLTVLLITLSVALPSHGDEDRDTRELEIIRDGHLGPLRIPTYQPTWADLSLLDELTTIASAGDLHTFGEKLLLSLGQRRGRLLVDGFDPQKFDDRSFHLPAPADVLRRWARTLPPGVLDGILERSLALPIDDAHPLLWLPEVAGAARLRLEEAIEAGDLCSAVDKGIIQWSKVHELRHVVSGAVTGRDDQGQIVYAKIMGTGVADVAAAKLAYDSAKAQGLGTEMDW